MQNAASDYTQLYLTLPLDPKVAMESLNQGLVELMDWMRVNKLKLNPDKKEVPGLAGASHPEELACSLPP